MIKVAWICVIIKNILNEDGVEEEATRQVRNKL